MVSYFLRPFTIAIVQLLLEDEMLCFVCRRANVNIMKLVVLDIRSPSPLSFTSISSSFNSRLSFSSSLMCSFSVEVKLMAAPGNFPHVLSIVKVLLRLLLNCLARYDMGRSSVCMVSS